jgi:hypothetical protein
MAYSDEMVQGCLRERATGRVVAHVSAGTWELLELQETTELELVRETLPMAERIPTLVDVQIQRNSLLNEYGWTVLPSSPLSAASQELWLAYLQQLQAVTKDLLDAAEVVWPEPPLPYEYADAL